MRLDACDPSAEADGNATYLIVTIAIRDPIGLKPNGNNLLEIIQLKQAAMM